MLLSCGHFIRQHGRPQQPHLCRGACTQQRVRASRQLVQPYQNIHPPARPPAQVPYVDVCDDARLATVAKALGGKAQEAGVAATISAGIWPGVDQLMAVEVCVCVCVLRLCAWFTAWGAPIYVRVIMSL